MPITVTPVGYSQVKNKTITALTDFHGLNSHKELLAQLIANRPLADKIKSGFYEIKTDSQTIIVQLMHPLKLEKVKGSQQKFLAVTPYFSKDEYPSGTSGKVKNVEFRITYDPNAAEADIIEIHEIDDKVLKIFNPEENIADDERPENEVADERPENEVADEPQKHTKVQDLNADLKQATVSKLPSYGEILRRQQHSSEYDSAIAASSSSSSTASDSDDESIETLPGAAEAARSFYGYEYFKNSQFTQVYGFFFTNCQNEETKNLRRSNMLMKKIPGQDLVALSAEYAFNEFDFVDIFYQIAKQIQRLNNDKKMSHQDVKPENIMYCPDSGKAHLIDFADVRKHSDTTSELHGTTPFQPYSVRAATVTMFYDDEATFKSNETVDVHGLLVSMATLLIDTDKLMENYLTLREEFDDAELSAIELINATKDFDYQLDGLLPGLMDLGFDESQAKEISMLITPINEKNLDCIPSTTKILEVINPIRQQQKETIAAYQQQNDPSLTTPTMGR